MFIHIPCYSVLLLCEELKWIWFIYIQHNKCSPQKTMAFVQRLVFWIKCSWKKHLWYWITNGLFVSDKFNGVFVLNGSLWNWFLIHSTTQVPQINIGRSVTDHCSKSSYHDLEDKPELTFGYRMSWTYPGHPALLVKSLLPEYLFYLFLPSFK